MMKQPFRFTFFLLICFTLPLTVTAQDGLIEADGPINIPDDNLRAKIEESFGYPSDFPITKAEMEQWEEFRAEDADITDLTGLEHATNLTSLYLQSNNISDISPLAELTNLTRLSLDGNAISDISPVSGLTKLTYLSLADTGISNISALAGLTNLTRLELDSNAIRDISALAGLTNLTFLTLQRNAISNISALAGLTNLTGLWLWDNAIRDISALAGLTNLTSLRLSSNAIRDISALAGLTNLTELNLWNNSISDISPLVDNTGLGEEDTVELRENPLDPKSIYIHIPALKDSRVTVEFDEPLEEPVNIPDDNLRAKIADTLGIASGDPILPSDMANLTRLDARNADITDLTGLEWAIKLTELYLGAESVEGEGWVSSNSVSDISPLADLTDLIQLDLRDNNITDLLPLARLTNLTWLNLLGNNIMDLSPLAGLTNLTWLHLLGNNITDLSPLAGLINLEMLFLRGNSISNLSPLAGLTNLTRLGVASNNISDLSPLAGLTNLTTLGLRRNRISDLSSLEGLTNLKKVVLISNYISDLSPLADNEGLGSGDEVNVKENPLNRASIETHIPALERKGVRVEFDNVITELVDILDDNLRAKIADALGKASDAPITTADMERLSELHARNADISNLTGLEFATNLTRLNLGAEWVEGQGWINRNSISDLSPLSGLTNLTELYLRNNSVSDISPLAELTNLTWLNLAGNLVSGLSPLAGLPNLTWLNLDGNSVSDFSPLANLTNLIHLSLADNSISNLSPLVFHLVGLTNLQRLYLNNNTISDISPLANLTNLIYLSLNSNTISDILPLANLTNLTYLSLNNNAISDISPLVANAGLADRDSVNVWGNPLSDASIQTHIPELQSRRVRVEFIQTPTFLLKISGTVTLSDNLLIVEVRDNRDRAFAGVTVTFTVVSGGGTLSVTDAITDTNGRAESRLTLGPNTGTNTVRVSVAEISEPVIFSDVPEPPVTIPDSKLRAAIESELDKSSGDPITASDMARLRHLDAQNANISNLTGLEGATNLTELHLGGEWVEGSGPINSNSISDLSPLSGLTNLSGLILDRNAITDISPLSELTKLEGLWLSNNSITDISPLSKLTNLGALGLQSNSITDISPLAGLANLGDLFLHNNSISDISILSELPRLGLLGLSNNNISDISPVAELTNLKSLQLSSNSISDISVVAGLTDLTNLSLDGNSVSDISAVAGLTNLEFLVLGDNSVSDISAVAGLTNLRFLILADNSIVDLLPLVDNTGLGEEDWVNVERNPLSFLSINTHIPELQNRGVEVRFDLPARPVKSTLSEHTSGVVSVAFSSRGMIASGSNDNTARLWNPVTESTTVLLRGHNGVVRSVAFSPDGSILATGSHDSTVILWDAATGQPKHTFTEHTAAVETVAFSRDGSTLASGSHDGTIILWDPVTGQPKDTIMGHANRVWSVAFSPDGTLAIGRDDGTVLLWDVANRQPKGALIGHTGFVESVAFNSDGSTLASGSVDTTVRLWKVATGEIIHTFTGHTGGVNGVAFSPDGAALASGADDSTVRLWDVGTGRPIALLTGHTAFVRSIAFSPDGSTLVSGSGDSTIRLWEIGPPILPEYTLSIPPGISLIHVPLKVTAVDGMAKTITSIADLYDALGGVDTVDYLVTHDPHDLPTQKWRSYLASSDKGTPADRTLTDDMGIIAGMKTDMKTPVSLRLSGTALGTDGTSTITLSQGHNLVGIPLRDERINRVSDLLRLDGIWGNVSVITVSDGGEFKVVRQVGDPGDIAITGGGAFILTAQQPATVAISGEAWTNVSETAAAPLVTRKGIEVGAATPVLVLRGAVVDEPVDLNKPSFRVTVKNLSTGRAVTAVKASDEADYRFTVVDVETGRAATIGDTLEISAQSPNPLLGVQPVRYTVTAEDVKRSRIQLPKLVVYEIPAETELLRNYPNPFNPETWIPYRLAEDAFVTLTIYDGTGHIVRTLDMGHQIAAVYENRSKAIYWDGRNGLGEQVASGVYFYHLSAGDYSATRKLVILK